MCLLSECSFRDGGTNELRRGCNGVTILVDRDARVIPGKVETRTSVENVRYLWIPFYAFLTTILLN